MVWVNLIMSNLLWASYEKKTIAVFTLFKLEIFSLEFFFAPSNKSCVIRVFVCGDIGEQLTGQLYCTRSLDTIIITVLVVMCLLTGNNKCTCTLFEFQSG